MQEDLQLCSHRIKQLQFLYTEQVGPKAKPKIHICKMPSLILDQDTGYLGCDFFFCDFLWTTSGKCRDSTLIMSQLLPSKSFLNHQQSYNLTQYSLNAESVI
jgi:hypothetical protein